jgi:ADP-L-glycero-D-manno-heptose 6-epimerase
VTPIFNALKREPKILFIEMPESLRPKYQYFTSANIGKLRAAGFESKITPLAHAVTDYVTNYLMPGRYLGDEN